MSTRPWDSLSDSSRIRPRALLADKHEPHWQQPGVWRADNEHAGDGVHAAGLGRDPRDFDWFRRMIESIASLDTSRQYGRTCAQRSHSSVADFRINGMDLLYTRLRHCSDAAEKLARIESDLDAGSSSLEVMAEVNRPGDADYRLKQRRKAERIAFGTQLPSAYRMCWAAVANVLLLLARYGLIPPAPVLDTIERSATAKTYAETAEILRLFTLGA